MRPGLDRKANPKAVACLVEFKAFLDYQELSYLPALLPRSPQWVAMPFLEGYAFSFCHGTLNQLKKNLLMQTTI